MEPENHKIILQNVPNFGSIIFFQGWNLPVEAIQWHQPSQSPVWGLPTFHSSSVTILQNLILEGALFTAICHEMQTQTRHILKLIQALRL